MSKSKSKSKVNEIAESIVRFQEASAAIVKLEAALEAARNKRTAAQAEFNGMVGDVGLPSKLASSRLPRVVTEKRQAEILKAFGTNDEMTVKQIAMRTGLTSNVVSYTLAAMKNSGKIDQAAHGIWRKTGEKVK